MDEQTKTVSGPPPFVRSNLPSAGDVIGGYEVQSLLAEGGQGNVYSVVHQLLGRPAALKVLHDALASVPEMTERFIQEAKIVNQLRHPGIVDIYDLGRLNDGRPYMVMELLNGKTLSEVLRRGRMEPERSLEYLRSIGAGLSAAHALGIVHRDVKAGNVFVIDESPVVRLKLLDFGIAKFMMPQAGTAGLTRAGERLGSAGTMAPEQYLGSMVDARTDLYGLAVTAYRMLTGRYPFASPDPDELERMHLEVTPRRPSDLAPIPVALDAVILKALEKNRQHRQTSIDAFIAEFAAAVAPRSERSTAAPVESQSESECIGLFVDIEMADDTDDDDEMLSCLADVLDTGERLLNQRGYRLEQQGNRQICGIRPLATGSVESETADAIALGEELYRVLSDQAPQLQIMVRACVGESEITRIGRSVAAAAPQ